MSTITHPATCLRPIGDRIVIVPDEATKQTRGGILVPEIAKEKPQRGKVLAVGDGALLPCGERATPSVKAGDVVLFARYSGTEIEADEQTVIIMSEKDVMAIVR